MCVNILISSEMLAEQLINLHMILNYFNGMGLWYDLLTNMSYWLTFDLLSVNFHIIYYFHGKLKMFLHFVGGAGGALDYCVFIFAFSAIYRDKKNQRL